jgi:uncharacterized protein (DUF58 family)
MKLELSENGQRLMFASILVALWGALFMDFILIGSGFAGLVFMGYRYYLLREQLKALHEQVTFSPETLDASFTAGAEYEEPIEVAYSGVSSPKLKLQYGEFKPSFLGSGKHTRIYRFKPSLAANYKFNKVSATLSDSLELVHGETDLKFGGEFRVYPRVFSVALDALRYLEGKGIIGAGEQVTETKGRGYEYADSREYVEGDDLRQIDWKATARLGKMIVKEYYTEGSGAIHIIYDTRVADPVSADVLAAEYLRTVLSFAERGWVIGLTVLDGSKVVSHFPSQYPSFAVSVALRHVLDSRRGEIMSHFDVLDPVYNNRLRRVLGDRLPMSDSEFSVLRDEMYGQRYGGVVYITCLTGNPSGLMELSYVARTSGTRFVALEPCRPWRYTGLEEAYKIHQQYDKVNKSLLRDGVPVAVNLVEAQAKLGEQEPLFH